MSTEAGANAALEMLLELQDLDTAISQLQHRRATLEERLQLEELEGALRSLGHRSAQAEAAKAELARRQADLEAQIAVTATRHAAIEQRLFAARGGAARDLQVMNEEMGHLSERRSELEDDDLEIMVALEPVDAELEGLGMERARLTETRSALRVRLNESERAIDADLSERVAQRSVLALSLIHI